VFRQHYQLRAETMKTKFVFSLPCAVVFLALVSQASAGLIVTNGDFEDLTGLTAQGGGWYSGVPAGWSGIKPTEPTTLSAHSTAPARRRSPRRRPSLLAPRYQSLSI
jgi:hypothetical protein